MKQSAIADRGKLNEAAMITCRLLGLFVLLVVGGASGACAEEFPIWRQAGMKLARGAVNFSTGWIELPKQIYLVGQAEGWVTGALRGPIDGLGMFVVRTVAGAYEVVTFPVPIPPRYQPMVAPEFIWEPDSAAGASPGSSAP